MSTLWHGRFEGGPAAELMAYTESLSFDRRLWPDDIAGSRAHVRGLARVGLLTDIERDTVIEALDRVEQEMVDYAFVFVESDEDIHTAVERRVTELAGAAGAKLHTARSRNDQVATDLRLWCKRELVGVEQADATEAAHVRTRAGDVDLRQALVERQAHGEREELLRGTAFEAAVPQRGQGYCSQPCRWAHVSMPRPQRRTKPAESSWRNASSRS